MSQDYNNLSKDNVLEVLRKCVLIRYLCVDGMQTYKKITYKNKIYKDNMVISEEKINVDISDIDKGVKLFNAIGFKNIVDVDYDVVVYKKGELEFAFQDVEGLGLLLEYENSSDCCCLGVEEILQEKLKMLEEVRKYNLDVSDEYDLKKACELLLKNNNSKV